MAQLVIRNLEAGIELWLQRRAKLHGRSLQEEERDILRDAREEAMPARGLGTEIASLFSRCGLETDIPELRGHGISPTSFDVARRRALARLRKSFDLGWAPPRRRDELYER